MPQDEDQFDELEISLLLTGINERYGYDFSGYAQESLRRRLTRRRQAEGLTTYTQLLDLVLHDSVAMGRLLRDLSINVTAMFRDPSFWKTFREEVLPRLETYPFLRFWVAGCSTGEEVYSLAILLKEAGLYDRSRIYATDINETVLERAREGIYDLRRMQTYTENYLAAGGIKPFTEYYHARYDRARFDRSLVENVIFARHNLVSDRSFNEFQVIFCRNVLIYFSRPLQDRVQQLFYDSLAPRGFLGLGHKESLGRDLVSSRYEAISNAERIYQKRGR